MEPSVAKRCQEMYKCMKTQTGDAQWHKTNNPMKAENRDAQYNKTN